MLNGDGEVEFFRTKTYRLFWPVYFLIYEGGLFFICCKGCEVIPAPRVTKITYIIFKVSPDKTVHNFGDEFATKGAEVINN